MHSDSNRNELDRITHASAAQGQTLKIHRLMNPEHQEMECNQRVIIYKQTISTDCGIQIKNKREQPSDNRHSYIPKHTHTLKYLCSLK